MFPVLSMYSQEMHTMCNHIDATSTIQVLPDCTHVLCLRSNVGKCLHLQWAAVEVDADAAENADVKPELEPGEFINVFLVPFKGLHTTLMVSHHQPMLHNPA